MDITRDEDYHLTELKAFFDLLQYLLDSMDRAMEKGDLGELRNIIADIRDEALALSREGFSIDQLSDKVRRLEQVADDLHKRLAA